MKVLVIGSGGREHALVWKLAQSPKIKKIYCAPGNAGIADLATCVDIAADNIEKLVNFAAEKRVDLTIVGPERPLVLGIVDEFQKRGLHIFGPTKLAAQLEASKVFTKRFCQKYAIPTARAEIFTDLKSALHSLSKIDGPCVVKADGLASGKGVIVCETKEEAQDAVELMMKQKVFGDAGTTVMIEEKLDGEEASFIAIADGTHVLPLASSQDHKRLLDHDRGPNTGGMGAYSPAPIVTPSVHRKVMEQIMLPTLRGMAMAGTPFTGILYAGLMIAQGEPKLLEFNVRFGDPEAQPLLMRLKNDVIDVIQAAMLRRLDRFELEWDARPAVCIVMAAKDYPEKGDRGNVITGLENVASLPDVTVFHAGTAEVDGRIVTNGGRVLGVTALGSNMQVALQKSYEAVSGIHWNGCQYRKDIGQRALR